MNKQSESPSASRRTTALVVLAVVLYWIWWDSFHEASRFYLAPPFTPSGSDPFYAYLSCFMRPVGIMAGCEPGENSCCAEAVFECCSALNWPCTPCTGSCCLDTS